MNIGKKKRIFGRRNTKPTRLFLGVVWGGIAVALGVFIGGFVGFYREIPWDEPFVCSQNHQGIVVFTGGQNRVMTGFELSEKFPSVKHILISGVNPKSPRKDVLASDVEGFAGSIDLDYESRTTYGNVMQTQVWVKKYNLERILVVTSNYHVPRSRVLLSSYTPQAEVEFYPVLSDNASLGFLINEFVKYLIVSLGVKFIN